MAGRAGRAGRAGWIGCICVAGAAAQAAPCDDPQALRAGTSAWQAAMLPSQWPLPVGRHFQLDVQLCQAPAAVRGVRVDADMPAHRHGMNYRASVRPQGTNRWRAEGLMLHMPGAWRLIVELDTAAGPQRLTHELQVP